MRSAAVAVVTTTIANTPHHIAPSPVITSLRAPVTNHGSPPAALSAALPPEKLARRRRRRTWPAGEGSSERRRGRRAGRGRAARPLPSALAAHCTVHSGRRRLAPGFDHSTEPAARRLGWRHGSPDIGHLAPWVVRHWSPGAMGRPTLVSRRCDRQTLVPGAV